MEFNENQWWLSIAIYQKKKIVFVQYKKVQASPSKQFTFLVYIRLYIENDSLSWMWMKGQYISLQFTTFREVFCFLHQSVFCFVLWVCECECSVSRLNKMLQYPSKCDYFMCMHYAVYKICKQLNSSFCFFFQFV